MTAQPSTARARGKSMHSQWQIKVASQRGGAKFATVPAQSQRDGRASCRPPTKEPSMSAARFITALTVASGLQVLLVNPNLANATEAAVDAPGLIAAASSKAVDIGPWRTVIIPEPTTSQAECELARAIDMPSATCAAGVEPALDPPARPRTH